MAYESDGGNRPPRATNDAKSQDPSEIRADMIDHLPSNQPDSPRVMRRNEGEGDQQPAIPSLTRNEQASISTVSPELIAEITERIKKEGMYS